MANVNFKIIPFFWVYGINLRVKLVVLRLNYVQVDKIILLLFFFLSIISVLTKGIFLIWLEVYRYD